ncbi:hypothetical protein Scep_013818 [Stephania cephalantha]|uniref:Transmembrane protein 45B n=1 Tax=Stephania cephalantha TaxID=152367 RepID=A0AAP0NYT6_9MAGN
MGTFVGHLVPGLTLALLGLWHIYNIIRAHLLKGKAGCIYRFNYPFKSILFEFKHLELILIFSFSILTIVLQIFDYPQLKFSFKCDNFEHATMFLHLAIYAGVALSVELMAYSPGIFRGLVGVLVISVFSQELLLLHYHSVDHVGLEGHYHWLLQLIVVASLVSAVAMTSSPSSFTAAFVLSTSVVFQGCWFMNMGFTLWNPSFVPKGCAMRMDSDDNMHGAVACDTAEATGRAKTLANLQFSWILGGILIFTASLCLALGGKFVNTRRLSEYEQLQIRVVDVTPISVDVDGAIIDSK